VNREGGVWWEYLYQTGGDRPGQMVNRSPGGIQTAVQQATGVGISPKNFLGGRFLVENPSLLVNVASKSLSTVVEKEVVIWRMVLYEVQTKLSCGCCTVEIATIIFSDVIKATILFLIEVNYN
jgi:hypothetical protein